jgi:hypothetical protein
MGFASRLKGLSNYVVYRQLCKKPVDVSVYWSGYKFRLFYAMEYMFCKVSAGFQWNLKVFDNFNLVQDQLTYFQVTFLVLRVLEDFEVSLFFQARLVGKVNWFQNTQTLLALVC